MKKRHLFQTAAAFCLAGMLLAFPASAAEADAPAEESAPVPVMSTETPNGTAYAWQPGGLYLKEDADAVFMDYFRRDLLYPLQTVDGVIFMALEDLRILRLPADGQPCDRDPRRRGGTVRRGLSPTHLVRWPHGHGSGPL